MTVSAQYAEEHIGELLDAASKGEEVEITMADKPPLKLVSASRPKIAPLVGPDGRIVLGAGQGELRVPSEEEWREYKQQMADLMNGPLLSSGEV
jgi:antitoxin (DNA-binding transcriptional repressor) of toxin-antitoxin stability system